MERKEKAEELKQENMVEDHRQKKSWALDIIGYTTIPVGKKGYNSLYLYVPFGSKMDACSNKN
jgi:hypothetical protein